MALNVVTLGGSKAALIFLIACLVLVLRRPGNLLAETQAAGLIWALAFWCLLSTLWSYAPGQTLRNAIQLTLTFAIAVAAASRLSISSVLRVVLVTSFLTLLLSLAIGRQTPVGHWVGIYASKNAFAQFCTVCVIAGLAVLLDPRWRGAWRLLGVLNVALGVLSLVKAGSAGALLAAMLTALAMVSFSLMRRLSGWQKLFGILMAALLCAILIVLIAGFFDSFTRAFLAATGKDLTLTGRTDLWRIAFQEIAAHPLLGQGFKGFWVPGNPTAEALWTQFGIDSKIGFHFHHSLISNAVEIGLIGVALQIAIVGGASFVLIGWAIAKPSAESLFLAGFMIRQLALLNSEVVFFTQFEPVSILTIMAAVYARRVLRPPVSVSRAVRFRGVVA